MDRSAVMWRLVFAWIALGGPALALADGSSEAEGASDVDGSLVIERLHALRPELPIESVRPAPVPGMVQIQLTGGHVLYATADARYLLSGELYEMGADDMVNLTEQERSAERLELLAAVDPDEELVFSPTGVTRASITVFTDIDCGFCRKLHLEVPRLNEMGIEVRYLAYPRTGIGSESYDKFVTAWCSKDRNDALTRMKRGEQLTAATCDNPVAEQYQLGRTIGVTGTPSIVFPNGEMVPGYLDADELARALGIEPS